MRAEHPGFILECEQNQFTLQIGDKIYQFDQHETIQLYKFLRDTIQLKNPLPTQELAKCHFCNQYFNPTKFQLTQANRGKNLFCSNKCSRRNDKRRYHLDKQTGQSAGSTVLPQYDDKNVVVLYNANLPE